MPEKKQIDWLSLKEAFKFSYCRCLEVQGPDVYPNYTANVVLIFLFCLLFLSMCIICVLCIPFLLPVLTPKVLCDVVRWCSWCLFNQYQFSAKPVLYHFTSFSLKRLKVPTHARLKKYGEVWTDLRFSLRLPILAKQAKQEKSVSNFIAYLVEREKQKRGTGRRSGKLGIWNAIL